MIRALLVDDEAPARSELRYLLGAHAEVEVVGEAASARGGARRSRASSRYDVVFLDVEMPGLTGVDAAPLVRERARPAGRRLRHRARASTPSRRSRSRRSTTCSSRSTRTGSRASSSGCASGRPRTSLPVEKIPVVAGGGTELLDFDQVHYVQADGDYSRVHTYDRSYLCTASLGELEERLGRRASRASTARTSSTSARSPACAAPRRTGSACSSPTRTQTELDVARRQSRQLRERSALRL